MTKISVTIITKNEAHDIRECLSSVQWADEIIVLDSGSTDGTPAICREYTDKVYETDWPGFGPQKNRALAHANGDWILSLDADERISLELKQEILQAIKSNDFQGYYIPRRSIYCGKLIKYGAWRSKPSIRLLRRGCGKFTDVLVHENIIVDGKVSKLKNPIIHYTYQNLEEVIEKINRYSTDSALQRFKNNKHGSFWNAITHGLWAFIYSYFFQLGFLDGKEGCMLAISNAEYSYYRYLKLMFLAQDNRQEAKEILSKRS